MTESAIPVIAIDGPSGVGKGTLARLLAWDLDWHLLDSGALYRLTALAAERHGIDFDDETALAERAVALNVHFTSTTDGHEQILLDGVDVSAALRSEICGNAASQVAALAMVRAALLTRQRAFRQAPGLIADGRDIGTVVFPDAIAKLFLTATPEERALRRHKQLIEKGINASLAALAREIAERDERDANRTVAPLRPAIDAITLETTGVSIVEVKRQVLKIIRERVFP